MVLRRKKLNLKYLFSSLLLLLASCNSKDEHISINSYKFIIEDVSNGFGGSVENKGNNFVFESRVIDCNYKSDKCNKAMIRTKATKDQEIGSNVAFSFVLTINNYNLDNSPPWVIIFQDWTRILPDDKNGNHPISTLTLVNRGGELYLQHQQNSYQIGCDFNGDIFDDKHRHQSPKVEGEKVIEIGVNYRINVVLTAGDNKTGGMKVSVNDDVISNATYQAKVPDRWVSNSLMWGVYHSYSYDLDYDPANKINISMGDFSYNE